MWLERFWEKIDQTAVGRFVSEREARLRETDPRRFYVQNVQGFFGIPHWLAYVLCEAGVREGVFRKSFALICPQCDSTAAIVDVDDMLPSTVVCERCQYDERSQVVFSLAEMTLLPFYSLRPEYLRREHLHHSDHEVNG
jgi:hypothetical protein